jgi:hypothetical protein
VNIYDPQVEEEQIWNDLSEASPLIPIESSMSSAVVWVLFLGLITTFISQSRNR